MRLIYLSVACLCLGWFVGCSNSESDDLNVVVTFGEKFVIAPKDVSESLSVKTVEDTKSVGVMTQIDKEDADEVKAG